MTTPAWIIVEGDGPLIATAIHDGHAIRPDALDLMKIPEAGRLREEDPYTAAWAEVAPTRVVGTRSRFEFDLNRPREKAVYVRPEDAWGLEVWHDEPPQRIVEGSLALYDAFYADLEQLCRQVEQKHGRFVIFDLHTYNHRRDGPGGSEADPAGNPQVNLGTGTVNRTIWGELVERFVRDLAAYKFPGGPLDVRENVKFQGGAMSRWIHKRFPETGCSLAVEFKKFFMDEWSGELNKELHGAIFDALQSTTPGVLDQLSQLGSRRA